MVPVDQRLVRQRDVQEGGEFAELLVDLLQERQVRAVIVTGAGDSFCAGADLAELHETSQAQNPLSVWHDDSLRLRELVDALLQFPKPIIAAVNGPFRGTGAGLILTSDVGVAHK